jgi:hypothetical protein
MIEGFVLAWRGIENCSFQLKASSVLAPLQWHKSPKSPMLHLNCNLLPDQSQVNQVKQVT